MVQAAVATGVGLSPAEVEQHVRNRIEALSYLPTTVGVAMKFIELGKDPEAEPEDYAKVISADSSLSTKILALANSSWFGVRNRVTKINVAVNLLGLGTVRTLAISYCMAGLHNELKLSKEEAHMFWEASLCKAVAAKQFTSATDPKLGDEAFAMALFQDFAFPVMFATVKERLLPVLQNPETDWQTQLQEERDLFRLDHTEIGRILAQKLELPDGFVDAVAFHHDRDSLHDFMEDESIADAVYAASLFPHVLNAWNRSDVEELRQFMEERERSVDTYADEVQEEFDQLYRFFEDGNVSDARLAELMDTATKEAADHTTGLVQQVNNLMQQAVSTGMEMKQGPGAPAGGEDPSHRDSITGLLNPDGFSVQATELLAKAARYGVGFGIFCVGLDGWQQVKETIGDDFSARALRAVAERMAALARPQDLSCSRGESELALLMNDCALEEAEQMANRIIAEIAAEPLGRGKKKVEVTASVGVLWVRPSRQQLPLDKLLSVSQTLMNQARQAGGNRKQRTTIPAE